MKLTKKGIAYFAVFWTMVLWVLGLLPGNTDSENAPVNVQGEMTVHFIDVGQADAAVILCGGEVMMIDGGNAADSSLIYSYLRNTLGIERIDCMIATHPHEDHIGGLAGALNACAVGKVYSPVLSYDSETFRSFQKYVKNQGLQMTVPQVGETFMLGGATVQFLSPAKQYADTNDLSIVVRIVFGNTSFLFTGDAEWEAEHDMIASGYDLSATVLKVGHHGSDSSSAYVFLREVMPEYAVISAGKGNSYGHPTTEVLSRLKDAGAQVLRTDLNGDVVVTTDGSKLTFAVEKGTAPVGGETVSTAQQASRTMSALEIIREIAYSIRKRIDELLDNFVSFIKSSIGW